MARDAKQPLARAIASDVQFWLPVGVLIFGIGLLALIK